MFISFEGSEGSGKSTQLKILADFLQNQGHEVVLVREPGGTALGEKLREVLLHSKKTSISPLAEVLLFSASRAQLIAEVIRPALARNAVVLADRFFDSTTVYQGVGRQLDAAQISAAHALAVGDCRPQKTFLFDLSVTDLRKRLQSRNEGTDRFESEQDLFFEAVRAGYLQLAKQEPDRFFVLDATASIEQIAAQVQGEVRCFLSERG